MTIFILKRFCALYAALLGLLPFFWWPASVYLVGGDDSKYEYLSPVTKLSMLFSGDLPRLAVSEGVVIQEFSGYPFYLVLAALNNIFPFLNTQQVLNGIILGGSFAAFFWFMSVLPSPGQGQSREHLVARFVASNVYALSMFTMITIWSHQLPVFVYLATAPLILGFLIRSTMQFKISHSLAASLIFALSPFPYASVPWLLPLVICGLPLCLAFAYRYPKDTFLTFVTFISSSVVMQFPTLVAMSEFGVYSHGMFNANAVSESIRIFKELNAKNSLIYPLGLSPNERFLNQISLYRTFPIQFKVSIYIYAVIMVGLVASATFVIMKSMNKMLRSVYFSIVVSWGISVICYTGGGAEKFSTIISSCMDSFPYLTMFRNNHDKFSIAISFFSGLIVFYSLLFNASFRVSNRKIENNCTVSSQLPENGNPPLG